MASIKKYTKRDGSTTYRVRVNGQYQHGTFRTMGDARKWAAEQEDKSYRNKFGASIVNVDKLTVGNLIERYETEVLPTRAPATIVTKGYALPFWKEVIGDTPLPNLSAELIERFKMYLWRERGYQPNSVNAALDALGAV